MTGGRPPARVSIPTVPLLRCTEEECGHQWFERSQLAAGTECELCGADTVPIGVDDEDEQAQASAGDEPAHPAHARARARQVAREQGFAHPPVVAHAIARRLGFTVRESRDLGSLRARLVDKCIEVDAKEPAVAQRFSVAHELGHHFLGTEHGSGQSAEREADAFAGELLIPGPMLREALNDTTEARQLRRLFRVSREVLEIAAKTHGVADRLTGS